MSDKPAVKTTETTQTKGPLAAQQPMYSDIWSKTGQAVQDFTPFDGNVVAGATDAQRAGAGGIIGAPVGTNAAGTADMARKVASGYFLDPNNDPTFQGTVNAALTPITRQLQEKVLPGIVDRSIKVGGTGGGPSAYGGASQDMQENQAVRDWAEQSANTTAQLANSSRTAGMNLIPQIPNLNAGANAEALAGPQASVAGGTLQQTYNQADLDNELEKWKLNQNTTLPFLQQAAQILSTGGFGDQSGKSTETGSAPSVAAQWLQGIAGGAGIANSMFGAPKGGTSAASGIMDTMKTLALLSDRRVKTDIEAIGKTFDGQIIYRYRYMNLPTWHIGLMADEVLGRHPAAVETRDGVMLVNYHAATEVAAAYGAMQHG